VCSVYVVVCVAHTHVCSVCVCVQCSVVWYVVCVFCLWYNVSYGTKVYQSHFKINRNIILFSLFSHSESATVKKKMTRKKGHCRCICVLFHTCTHSKSVICTGCCSYYTTGHNESGSLSSLSPRVLVHGIIEPQMILLLLTNKANSGKCYSTKHQYGTHTC